MSLSEASKCKQNDFIEDSKYQACFIKDSIFRNLVNKDFNIVEGIFGKKPFLVKTNFKTKSFRIGNLTIESYFLYGDSLLWYVPQCKKVSAWRPRICGWI